MTTQPDLFTPQSRHADPDTSRAAGRSMQKGAAIQRDRIVNALELQGPMNHWELDNVLGFQHPTAARRLKELVDALRIRKTGKTSPTGSGREAMLYEVVT